MYSNVITIKPMKSVDDTNEMNASHQSSELNGSRGAKEKIKENFDFIHFIHSVMLHLHKIF